MKLTPQAQLELDWMAQKTGLPKVMLLAIAMARLTNDYNSGIWLPPKPRAPLPKIKRTNKGLRY